MIAVAFGLSFYVSAALLSWASAREWPVADRKSFHAAGGVAVFLSMLGWMNAWSASGAHRAVGLFASFFGVLPGFFLLVPWFRFLAAQAVEGGRRSLVGLDRMKVRKTYDLAERAVRERRWVEAEARLLSEVSADPGESEPWRRIGDVRLAMGDLDGAVEAWGRALDRLDRDEDRASLAFRIADALGSGGRPREARQMLERARDGLRGTKFAIYADRRLERLE